MDQREGQFDRFYKEYYRYVYALCRQYLQREEEVQDAVLEAFLRLWRNWDNYDLGRGKGLLRVAARHACLDTLRHRRAVPDLVTIPEDLAADESTSSLLLKLLLSECLEQLTEEEFEVLCLRHENHTRAEITRWTGLTPSSIRTREEQALKRLRACLEKE